MTDFADHFSQRAHLYARYRPGYPPELYRELSDRAPRAPFRRAWDVGTGSGQVARGLAPHFDEVVATDASAQQLHHARPAPGVVYRQALAERSGLEPRSVVLVTCGASVHWFDQEAFYEEVRRVAVPGALLAVWSYWCEVHVAPGVDALVEELAERTLDPDWPEGIHLPRGRYAELPFPFEEEPPPDLALQMRATADQLLGWLRTWSALEPHRRRTGQDALEGLEPRLRAAWPRADGGEVDVRVPLFFRLGRVRG